jgi:hypothetical protein
VKTTSQHSNGRIASKIEVAFTRLLLAILRTALIVILIATAQADDHKREDRRESHNYILERQEAYQVQGVPTSRLIIGRREIDVYSDGKMFEGNNLVGVRSK